MKQGRVNGISRLVSEVKVEEEADNGKDDASTWEDGEYDCETDMDSHNLLIHIHSIIWNTHCMHTEGNRVDIFFEECNLECGI